MSRERPLLVPAKPQGRRVHLRFDEALIEARPEDTLATALIAAGVLMTSRSAKYRRPRGAYCLSGDCGTCLVRVDGRPNVRACTTAVREGMRVSSQNAYRPSRLDPTAMVDAMFPEGLDHHHLMVRPRLANQVMQEFARNLAGFGELPEGVGERACEHVAHELPALIVGAGPAGRAAAAALEDAGVDHMILDRYDLDQLRARHEPEPDPLPLPARLLASAGVFGLYPGPRSRLVGHEGERALLAASELDGQVERLHSFRPRHLILATGCRDPMLPFANNDLPGIVSARGLIHALHRADARLAGRCVVVGKGEWAERQQAILDGLRSFDAPKVERVDPEEVERAVGKERVEELICRTGRMSCALLAVAADPAPAHELAALAGLELRFDGSGFAVARPDREQSCGALGGTSLWAAGDLCGWLGPKAAASDGARVGRAVVAALEAEPGALAKTRRFAPVEPPQPPPMRERPVVDDAFRIPADPEAVPAPASPDDGQEGPR